MILDGFWELPIHPPFVHFPVAMLSAAWGLIVLGYLRDSARWQDLATSVEWLGLAFVPITGITGLRDAEGPGFLIEIDWTQPLIWHVLVSSAATLVFLVHAVARRRASRQGRLSPWIDLGLSSLGFWLLMGGGLIAGEMVYG